jgi:hypothetical protein
MSLQSEIQINKQELLFWGFMGFVVFNATFNNIFSYIVAVSFTGGGNQSTRSKPPTCLWRPYFQPNYFILFLSDYRTNSEETFSVKYSN